jgi:multisubunit Na+/H+ antiporter MnhG subunit
MIRSAIFVLLAGVALWHAPDILRKPSHGVTLAASGVLFPAGGYYYQMKGACDD